MCTPARILSTDFTSNPVNQPFGLLVDGNFACNIGSLFLSAGSNSCSGITSPLNLPSAFRVRSYTLIFPLCHSLTQASNQFSDIFVPFITVINPSFLDMPRKHFGFCELRGCFPISSKSIGGIVNLVALKYK